MNASDASECSQAIGAAAARQATPRNIVICCDGTSNQFGSHNTNVVRLVQVLDRDPDRQRVFYDPGVGTLPEPGWTTWIGQKFSQVRGKAIGGGLDANVLEAYCYLIEQWKPGDRVFLFGFSRGAYTVRVLAGMLHALGLLSAGSDHLAPYVMRLFKAVRKRRRVKKKNYWRLSNSFRRAFARETGHKSRRFPIHFLGVWDTVSSVGWAWDPATFPYTRKNPSIATVRHALAIDERRWFFRQNSLSPAPRQDFLELWFPGVHADVGGGYPEDEGDLWRVAFEWLLQEAIGCGLTVEGSRIARIRKNAAHDPWAEPQHESLRGCWHLAEYFPKRPFQQDGRRRIRFGRHRNRFIPEGALIHGAALLRLRANQGYAPGNLSQTFVEKVRALTVIPQIMANEK